MTQISNMYISMYVHTVLKNSKVLLESKESSILSKEHQSLVMKKNTKVNFVDKFR